MDGKLELLAGDKYALRDNSLIILVGDSGCASLQSVANNPFTQQQAVADGKALVERLMENVNKEIGYQTIFGVDNLESALRQAVSDEKGLENYNIFIYKLPDGMDIQPGLQAACLAEEVAKEYEDIYGRYLICRDSYDRMSDQSRKLELQQKLKYLNEMVKNGKDTSAMEYLVSYIARKIGTEYESIVDNTVEIIENTNKLSELGVQVDPARLTLLEWNRELLIATSLRNQEKIGSLSQSIARYKQKIGAMLETKQKQNNRPD